MYLFIYFERLREIALTNRLTLQWPQLDQGQNQEPKFNPGLPSVNYLRCHLLPPRICISRNLELGAKN